MPDIYASKVLLVCITFQTKEVAHVETCHFKFEIMAGNAVERAILLAKVMASSFEAGCDLGPCQDWFVVPVNSIIQAAALAIANRSSPSLRATKAPFARSYIWRPESAPVFPKQLAIRLSQVTRGSFQFPPSSRASLKQTYPT